MAASISLDTLEFKLGPVTDSWTYSTSDAYFKKYPIDHLQGKTLLGLFFSKEVSDGTLVKVPADFIKNEIMLDSINLHSRKFITSTLSKISDDIKIEDEQFIALICEGKYVLTIFKLMTECTISQYTESLIQFLNFWNKYGLDCLNEQVKQAIDRLLSFVIIENDNFWCNLKDNLTQTFKNRRFDFSIVKRTEGNAEELKKIEDAVANIKKYEENPEYKFDELKYKDISEFLIKPLPVDEYYNAISRAQFYNILQSCGKINSSMVLKTYAVFACSFKYYHLLLDKAVLDFINRVNEPLILSYYTRYLLYMMYKEETIYKSHSNITHRHVVPRDVSCRLALILEGNYAKILPATANIYGSSRSVSINLGRGLYSTEQCKRRMELFTGSEFITKNLADVQLLLPKGTKLYIVGSFITATSTRFLRNFSPQEIKDAKVDMENDFPIYKKNYKNSDIDIAIYSTEDDFKTSVYTIYNFILSMEKCSIIALTREKYRIKTSKFILEIFRMYYENPISLIYNFHLPCVRSVYVPETSHIYDLPSFIYSGLTSIQLDFRYCSSMATQLDIINKYQNRGFKCLLNQYEKDLLSRVGYDMPEHIDSPLQFYLSENGNSANLSGMIRILNRGRSGDTMNIKRRINKMMYSTFVYSIDPHAKFWNSTYQRINVPKYPATCPSVSKDYESSSGINIEELLSLFRDIPVKKKLGRISKY